MTADSGLQLEGGGWTGVALPMKAGDYCSAKPQRPLYLCCAALWPHSRPWLTAQRTIRERNHCDSACVAQVCICQCDLPMRVLQKGSSVPPPPPPFRAHAAGTGLHACMRCRSTRTTPATGVHLSLAVAAFRQDRVQGSWCAFPLQSHERVLYAALFQGAEGTTADEEFYVENVAEEVSRAGVKPAGRNKFRRLAEAMLWHCGRR
jgi:hypothetical protein